MATKVTTTTTSVVVLSCLRNGLNPTARSVHGVLSIVCRMDETPFVLVADDGPVRRLTLHNPRNKNAIPRHGWQEIIRAVEGFSSSGQRVLVIEGSDDNFCSGAELRSEDLIGLDSPAGGRDRMQEPVRLALALHRLPKPTIAAVDGVAAGAGMNLAIGCDVVVATSRSQFSEASVKRGLTLALGGTWLLPRLVGMAQARDLALTGRIVGGKEAVEIGLASRLVEPEYLDEVVMELAGELAAGAPLAQRLIKTALSRSTEMSFEQTLAFERQSQAALLASDDVAEGIDAFGEGRPPEFGGR